MNISDWVVLGTYTTAEPSVGELRYIFRLTGLDKTYPTYSYGDVSDTAGGTAIEGSDVYTVNGQTRSKVYTCPPPPLHPPAVFLVVCNN